MLTGLITVLAIVGVWYNSNPGKKNNNDQLEVMHEISLKPQSYMRDKPSINLLCT